MIVLPSNAMLAQTQRHASRTAESGSKVRAEAVSHHLPGSPGGYPPGPPPQTWTCAMHASGSSDSASAPPYAVPWRCGDTIGARSVALVCLSTARSARRRLPSRGSLVSHFPACLCITEAFFIMGSDERALDQRDIDTALPKIASWSEALQAQARQQG